MNRISGKPLKTRDSGTLGVAGIPCLLLGLCQGSMGTVDVNSHSGHKSAPSVAVLTPAPKGLTPMAVNMTPVVTVLTPPLVFGKPAWMRLKKRSILSIIIKSWQGRGFGETAAVRLIAPTQMTDEEIMKFQSSLREVMLFIKYSKDKENLSRVLAVNEERFREVERRAADVIEAITNSGIKYDESEELVNVCQAIQEMRKESERDGELKKAKEAARNFCNFGVDVEKMAQGVGLIRFGMAY